MEHTPQRESRPTDWFAAHVVRRISCPRQSAVCVWLVGALVAIVACQVVMVPADRVAPAPFGLLLAPPVALLVLAYVIWPLERAVARRRV